MPVENENSYPMVSRKILRDHITRTTRTKCPPLEPAKPVRPWLPYAFAAIIIATLIMYQLA